MKRTIIGIDIGERYTKVVELDAGGKISVINTFLISTPFLPNTEKKSIDSSALCQSIIEKIPLYRLNKSLIAVSIPIFSPVVATIVLPKMNRKELGSAASIEARRKMIPQPGPNSVFETSFLREVIESNIPRYEVLVVREEKEFVTMASGLFKKFDLYPHIITPVCASLGSIFAKNPEYRDKEIAFIDIGYNSMNISVNRGTNIIFNRNVSFGCKDIIQGLAGSLGLTYEQAENILLKNGVPNIPFDSKDRVAVAEEIMRQKYEAGIGEKTADEVNQLELRMLMEQFLERIIQEIRRTFIYFKERHGTRKIEKIFFLGGGALINNLINLIGTQISPHPDIMDISKIANASFKDNTHKDKFALFSGATALALSTTLKAQKIIDFLPFELKKRKEITAKRLVLSIVCVVVTLSFLIGGANLWLIGFNRKRSLEEVSFETRRLQRKNIKIKSIMAAMESAKNRGNIVKSLIEKKKDFLPILRLLAAEETDEMVFSYLHITKSGNKQEGASSMGENSNMASGENPSSNNSVNGYTMELKTKVLEDYEKACDIMEKFADSLKRSPYFKNVSLTTPNLGTVNPAIISKDTVSLTKVKWQEFTVKAELNI